MRNCKIRLEVRSPLASSEMFADFLRANNIEMAWETGRGHPQNAMFYGTKEALEQLVWDFFNTGSWNEDYPIDYSNDDFAEFIYLMERVEEDNGKLREARYFLYGQDRNNAYDIDAGAPIWDKKKYLVKEFYASTEEKAKEFLKESNEFELVLANNDFQKMNRFLIDNYGFKEAWTHTNQFICYTNKKNVRFDIYLDPKKPNRVIKLRADELNKKTLLSTHALIGNFPGGKAPFRAFSFSSPEVLVKKLENWKL